jgi:hypothetical protein
VITDMRGSGLDWSADQTGELVPCSCGCTCNCGCNCNCVCMTIAPDGDLPARSYPHMDEDYSNYQSTRANTMFAVTSPPEYMTVEGLFVSTG